MNRPGFFFTSLLLWVLLNLFADSVCAQSVEESLDKINRLPAAERQQKLSEGARKEGELVWYSTMNREPDARKAAMAVRPSLACWGSRRGP